MAKISKVTLDQFLEIDVLRAVEDAKSNPKFLDHLTNLEDNRIWFSRLFHEKLSLDLGERYPLDFVRNKMLGFCGNIYTCQIIAQIYEEWFSGQPDPIASYHEHFFGYIIGELMATKEDTRLLLHNAIPIITMPSYLVSISVVEKWLMILSIRNYTGSPVGGKANKMVREDIDRLFSQQSMPAYLKTDFDQKLDRILPRLLLIKKSGDQDHLSAYAEVSTIILS
jgi:hypothetical protein